MMKYIKIVITIIVFAVSVKLLAGLGEIHGQNLPESYFSAGYPSILGLLNSELFMSFIFLVTLSIVAYILYLLWQLHEVAVHKAEKNASPQLQLVFALSLSGLFIDKAWWVLAIIITFTSWQQIGDWISDIIHNNRKTASTNKETGAR